MTHELRQRQYHPLAVKMFHKVAGFDSFPLSLPGFWDPSAEWLKISLGLREMPTPELQTPSVRVAPGS